MEVENLIEIIEEIVDGEGIEIDENSPLIGGNSSIDSMNLVQICLALEEKSTEDNFIFDWTSEKAMSTLSSIFRDPTSLTEEYNRQKNNK
tara:strand:- start:382 stop:651 length:270 start_codon:yes stop_codon:yes gene_type:complete